MKRQRSYWVASPANCACSDGCVWCYRPTPVDDALAERAAAHRAEQQRINAEVAAGTFRYPLHGSRIEVTW